MSVNGKISVEISGFETIKIYKVTEEELKILERGNNSSIFLNVSLVLLSIALSATFTFLTFTTKNIYALTFLYAVMITGYIGGTIFLVLSLKSKNSSREILDRIRRRIKKAKEQEEIPA